jgi:alpha-N-acetylglucosaminidase
MSAWLRCAIFVCLACVPIFATPTDAARGVLQRMIGERATNFTFEEIPTDNGLDVYEIEAAGGKVIIRGSSGVSLSRGAYAYLREACNCMSTWAGRNTNLPAVLPDFARRRVVSPFPLRQYYNVCTYGYTTAYWDWNQWEKELDWMALHGINMPLMGVGTEAIWRRVWMSFGVSEEELDQYFTGPAYYPWHRMGNINRWDGPAPRAFFDKQIALQKKIIARVRELGMEPIAPAFAGFVPPALERARPEAKLVHLDAWAGFDVPYRTHLLDPTSPLYAEIGKKFIDEWRREFGDAKYFLADSFNELKVPVPADRKGRMETLAKYGDAVYQSILAGEPDAVWVMQGWLFYFQRDFWDKESAAALLSRVPDDRMILLDLACDFRPMWKDHDAFYGKQWIYSIIHNMGGRSSVGGDLPFYASESAKTLASPKRGKLIGSGIAAEGVENNEVVYELLTDAMWTRNAIDLDAWLQSYCCSRYGACPDAMRDAWKLLLKTTYSKNVYHTRPGYQYRPKPVVDWKNTPEDSPEFLLAVRTFLSCADALKTNELYRADAIELTSQYLSNRVDEHIKAALASPPSDESHEQQALALMSEIDALLASHPIYRLDRWLDFARAWGDTPNERAYFEQDARRQITTWGGPRLTEYASKMWAGMVGDYYRGRWDVLFNARKLGKTPEILAWEESWIHAPALRTPAPSPDPIARCEQLLMENPR